MRGPLSESGIRTRIAEIDAIFENAEGWRSWMAAVSKERHTLVELFKQSGGTSIAHKYVTGTRLTLPARRATESFAFTFEGLRYVAHFSCFADGAIGELFLNQRMTTAADKAAHDAAIMFSLARQHGVPCDVIFGALAKLHDGSPATAFGIALQCVALHGVTQ